MRFLYLATLLLLVATAAAQDSYVSVGLGNISCGKFVDDRRADSLEDGFNQIWLGGYLTRFSRDERIDSFEMDMPSMMLWIENYCIDNPVRNFAYAAARLTVYLEEEDLVKYVQ